jgi:5'-3' exonuclease
MDLTKNIVFCDASYFVFYRYYAIKGWYKRAKELDIDVENILNDEEFIGKYDSTFEKLIMDISRKYNVPYKNIVFAKDCTRERIWRTKLFPDYKACRDEKITSFNGDIFKHTYYNLFPRLQKKYNFIDILHNNLEADDVIALFVKYIRNIDQKCKIVVITNDNDYVQLYKYNIEIYNLQAKSLRDRIEDVDNYLEYKIIVGDKSDNIKSIGKKIGDKTAKKMLENEELYTKILQQPNVKETYILNKTLIDFDCIPSDYKKEVEMMYSDILKPGIV